MCKCRADFTGEHCEGIGVSYATCGIYTTWPIRNQDYKYKILIIQTDSTIITKIKNPNSCYLESACKDGKLDVLYVVDGSGSVRKRNFKKIKQFTQKLSGRFDIGSDKTRVAFMQFGRASKTRLEFGLGEENTLSGVNKAINRIKYLRSRTETGDALRRAREVISANILNDFVSAHLYTLFVCFFLVRLSFLFPVYVSYRR